MPENPLLIIAASEHDSNLYYATRFLAPDAFIYLRDRGQSILLMSDLEMDRAKAQAKVDTVLSYTAYEERAKAKMNERPRMVHVARELLSERGVQAFDVPANFPIEYGDAFRSMGYAISVKPDPLFPSRVLKEPREVEAISTTQRAVEEAVAAAKQPIIFDVFPRSSHSRYFADMSRTVVKGRASDGMKRLYETVLEAQEWGAAQVKAGVNAQTIHEGIC